MADVYSNAQRTLIFLGPEAEISQETSRFFAVTGLMSSKLGQISPAFHRGHLETCLDRILTSLAEAQRFDEQADLDKLIAMLLSPDMDDQAEQIVTTAVSTIMGAAWWSCVWTIQELMVSDLPISSTDMNSLMRSTFPVLSGYSKASMKLYNLEAAITKEG